jgi:hypothetical protein
MDDKTSPPPPSPTRRGQPRASWSPARKPVVVGLGGLIAVALSSIGCGDDGADASGAGAASGTGASGSGASGTGASGTGGAGTGTSGSAGGTGATGTGGAGACGACGPDEECSATGECVAFCGSSCADGCGPCPSNSSNTLTCTASGLCKCNPTCTPDCTGKACGDDGCGGVCGSACGANQVCAYDRNAGTPWTCQGFGGADPGMSFFVTSRGTGEAGGNLGGLAGADAKCASLAEAAGVGGKTWRAYLSAGGTNARDRIGSGPWMNARGQSIVSCGGDCLAALHTDGILAELVLTEKGTQLDWANAHDVLTGSYPDGTASGNDCEGWTSSDEFGAATVGHANEDDAWASAHDTGCDQVGMQCTAGQGHVYCFAL